MLAVDHEEPVRLHTSSGTTGKPKAIFFSRKDVDNAADLIARSLVMTGITRKDVFQNMMSYGLFTGGLVMHYGAEKVGCLVIPAGPGTSERQLMLMQDFHTTAVHILPSYALYFASFLEQKGIDPRKDLTLRKAFVGAEPHTEETRRRIEQAYGCDVYNSYGLTEMNGPGVAFECEYKAGLHLWEDNFLLEIINPETGEPAARGRDRRAGAHHASTARPCPSCATARATSPPSSPSPASAGAPTAASTASPAAPTTCSSSAA